MLRLMVIGGPDVGLAGEFDTEVLTLGRTAGSGFMLSDPRVSGRHGEITRAGGTYRYRDLGSRNGTQLVCPGHETPLRVEGTVPLADGDALALGPGTLVGVRTGLTATAEVSPAPAEAQTILERLQRDPVALLTLFQFDRTLAEATSLPELWATFRDGLAAAFPSATYVVVLAAEPSAEEWRPTASLDRRRGAISPHGWQGTEVTPDAERGDLSPPSLSAPGEVAFSRAMATEVARARRARLYRDSFRDLPVGGEGHVWPVFATLCAPLLTGEEVIGVVQVEHRSATGTPFDAEDLDLLAALCARTATAIAGEQLRSRRHQSQLTQLTRALDRDTGEWALLISSLTDDLAGSGRRLLAALDAGETGLRARIAGERDYFWDCLETLRANVMMARQVAFPLSHFLLERSWTLEREPIEVGGLLRQLARTERPRAAHEIEVTELMLPPVLADRPRLFRALLNLLENALDAQQEGGEEVRVRLHAEVAPTSDPRFPEGRLLAIHVSDTGPGIAPDVLERLRAGEAITTRPQGTGMGLRIARDIVAAHGGDLTLESEEGRGTTATVSLPLA